MKKLTIIFFSIFSILILTSCNITTYKEANLAKNKGFDALRSNNYKEAKECFELSIKKGNFDEELKTLCEIITDYEQATNLFVEEKFEESLKLLQELDNSYKKYSIKNDILKLEDLLSNELKTQ
ncbi:MAG: hypothetical protein ACRDD2_08530 [Sarcina sp.]